MKWENRIGAAAAVLGSLAYGIFALTQKKRVQPLKAVEPEIAPEIAIRRERPVVPPPLPPPSRPKFFADSEFSVGAVAPQPLGPVDNHAFGKDMERNEEEEIRLDDYLNLPLESGGLTHTNRHAFQDLEKEAVGAPPPIVKFTFFRLKVLATRDRAAATAAIGGFVLMNGKEAVYHPGAKLWNPHTGSRETFYPEAGWSDSEQKELIVKFPKAVAVNRYRLRTSEQDTAFDPVEWRLEGSQNGLYWFPLDERKTTALPVERGTWIAFSMRLVGA